jgi:hypothetical protein
LNKHIIQKIPRKMSQYPNFNMLHGNDIMDDVASADFQHRQHQMQMYDGYSGRDAMEQQHNSIPPHMYGGPQFGSAQEEEELWRKQQQQQSYMQGSQMQQGYQGNLHQHGMSDGNYYHQFPNMNAVDSYQSYLHRPSNQDPEVAQAMLNLGNDRDGHHRLAPNDPAAQFFPPPPQYYYHPMDMQHMGHAQGPGGYYPTVHPREPQMYPPLDQGDRQLHAPPQQHPIAIDKKRKRPSDMPRRPLSAYNFFFSEERERILAEISEDDEKQDQNVEDENSNEKKEDKPQDKGNYADDSPSNSTKNTDNHDSETPPSKDAPQDATSTNSEPEKKSDVNQESETSTPDVKSGQDVDPNSCGERLLSQRWEDSKKRRPHRKSHGKIAFKDLAKLIGQRWHKISQEQKKKYNKLAEKDLERYAEQMKVYNSKKAAKKMEGLAAANFTSNPGHLPPNLMHQYGMPGHPQMMMHHQMVSDPKEQNMDRQNGVAPAPSHNEQGTK